MMNWNVASVCFLSVLSVMFSVNVYSYEDEIDKLSMEMAEKIAAVGKKKVAVVDFTDLEGQVTLLGRFLAEEFSAALASSGKGFQVIDRTRIKTLLKEHKLAEEGFIDPQSAKELGRIAGVEALVTGVITPFGESVRLSIKILDTETAEVVEAKRGKIAKTSVIAELLATGFNAPSVGKKQAEKQPTANLTSTKIQSTERIQKAEDFAITLQSCRLSGKTLTCKFGVLNESTDRTFTFYGNTNNYATGRFFDKNGNVYHASNAKLLNVSNSNYASAAIPSGIPVKGQISFDGLPTDLDTIAMLEVRCTADKKNLNLQFRGVEVARN